MKVWVCGCVYIFFNISITALSNVEIWDPGNLNGYNFITCHAFPSIKQFLLSSKTMTKPYIFRRGFGFWQNQRFFLVSTFRSNINRLPYYIIRHCNRLPYYIIRHCNRLPYYIIRHCISSFKINNSSV